MLVVPDIGDAFAPIDVGAAVVRYHDARHVIDPLLQRIPTMFPISEAPQQSALGSALQAAAHFLVRLSLFSLS